MALSKTNVGARIGNLSKITVFCDKCEKPMKPTKILTSKTKGMYYLCECGEAYRIHKGQTYKNHKYIKEFK